ncbi:MAG: tetratricopeptide repeat protein [Bacteroidota bacterium]|nr:tetratricopeptide repeat protein [Bacteroidota bacterium]
MKRAMGIFFFVLIVMSAYGQTKYKDAKALFEQKKFKKAMEMIDKDIDERGFLEDNAVLKTRIGMYIPGDISFETIQKAIKAFPESAKVYHARAILYYEMRDLKSSILDDSKALELCTDDSLKLDILISRGGCYHHLEQIENSIRDCRAALELRPASIEILNNLSTALFDKGESVESMEILEKIKRIDPKFMGSYINLGYQNQQLKRYAEAERQLLEGLKIDPNDAYILNNLGFVQHNLGKSAEGIKNINKSIKVNPRNSYCFRNLALIYLDQNEKNKACENIHKALDLGFSSMYGSEMTELSHKHCLRK